MLYLSVHIVVQQCHKKSSPLVTKSSFFFVNKSPLAYIRALTSQREKETSISENEMLGAPHSCIAMTALTKLLINSLRMS